MESFSLKISFDIVFSIPRNDVDFESSNEFYFFNQLWPENNTTMVTGSALL